MKKQTILMLMDWFLPGTKSGGPVRSYANMIAYLGDYYNFKIITRDTDYCETEPYTSIRCDAWNTYNQHTEIYYISKDKQTKAQLKQLLENTTYDQLYISGIYSWYFSILPLLLRSQQVPTLVAPRGMLNPQAFSVKPLKKKVYIAMAKAFNLYKNVKFHVTNADEAAHVKSRLGNHSIVHIAPNLPRKIENLSLEKNILNQPLKLVNVARISKEKGTLKMIEALSGLQNELVLDIFGPIYDDAYWEKCKKAIEQLPQHTKVNYKGFIESALVLETIKEYDFFILLSEGENFGHSILEALSVGCPVIISENTPWRDLETKGIGWDLNIDDSKETSHVFEHISKMNQVEYNEMSKQAFIFAKRFSEDKHLLNQNKNLFL